MKTTIQEEIKNFKRLIGEATDTSSSGSYEQPLGFNQERPTTICPTSGKPLVGTEMTMSAPEVDVVDVTSGVVPMDEPTSYEGNMDTVSQPAFDDMPYLSSHPSGWSFEGDEEELDEIVAQEPYVQADREDDDESGPVGEELNPIDALGDREEEEDLEETISNDEWYQNQLFESLTKKWAK